MNPPLGLYWRDDPFRLNGLKRTEKNRPFQWLFLDIQIHFIWIFQDEKNQLLITNMWLKMVSVCHDLSKCRIVLNFYTSMPNLSLPAAGRALSKRRLLQESIVCFSFGPFLKAFFCLMNVFVLWAGRVTHYRGRTIGKRQIAHSPIRPARRCCVLSI